MPALAAHLTEPPLAFFDYMYTVNEPKTVGTRTGGFGSVLGPYKTKTRDLDEVLD